MRPVDPRLLRYARSTRWFMLLACTVGGVTAVLVIAQANLIAEVIVDVSQGANPSRASSGFTALALIVAARALMAWLGESFAYRTASEAKKELRQAALERAIMTEGARTEPESMRSGEIATLITRGLDGLDGYYARYLPQLILAVIVPVAVLLTIVGMDVLSTVIIAVTIPLIPLFMVLIGFYTRDRVNRQWETLSTLSGHFLDLVSGLPTLKVFGRAHEQVRAIRAIGDQYRRTTMGVLRVSFLSSLALELLATLSVAVVAVSIGLRLASGQVTYSVALVILLLAPEAYLPLRLVGQHFHAAAEGLGAAERVFALLDAPAPRPVHVSSDSGMDHTIDVSGLAVTYPGRDRAAVSGFNLQAQPGQIVALVGPSGGGKSTILAVLLGFVTPTSGRVKCPAREHIAWLPQSPHLVSPRSREPSIREVVLVGHPQATDEEVREALVNAGVWDEVCALPAGMHTRVSLDGSGLSEGQRRRIALARALIRRAPILLLDEPTAALDGHAEAVVGHAIRAAADAGATVVVVAHRPALVADADVVVRVGSPVDHVTKHEAVPSCI